MTFNEFIDRLPFYNWLITYEVLDDCFNCLRKDVMTIRAKSTDDALNEFLAVRPTKRAQPVMIGLAVE